MATLGHPTPILRSFDEARTKDFYLNYLGFELVF
ncbi:glyoxalase superfamily protein, partial [Streptococcus suis]